MKRLWDTVMARFDDDNAEWGLSRRAATLIFLAPFALAVVAVVLIPFRPAFGVLANEDGIAEWGQWLFLVALVVIYARLAIALWQPEAAPARPPLRGRDGGGHFTAGEEICWGQRNFGWMTPGALDDINNQGETNIHNIGSILKIFNLVIMIVAFIAALLPIVRWTAWRAGAIDRGLRAHPAGGPHPGVRDGVRVSGDPLSVPAGAAVHPDQALQDRRALVLLRAVRVRRPRLARHRPRLAAVVRRHRRAERPACRRAARGSPPRAGA